MGKTSRCVFLVIQVVTPAVASDLQLTVMIYNYAGLPAETLARGEAEAARIYEQIGVATDWLDCPLAPGEAAQYPDCEAPPGPARLALRLVSNSMAERYRFAPDEFGAALLTEDGSVPNAAIVCAECALKLAKGNDSLTNRLLGCLMAHEMGHLLLGAGGHSASGIMHVPWHHKELEQVAQGGMNFMSWQGEQIRGRVQARMKFAAKLGVE